MQGIFKKEQPEVVGLQTASDELKSAIKGKQQVLEQGLVNLSIGAKNQDLVKLSIETPEGLQRVPNDIVCVLDISGSMATEAHVKNTQGEKERHGLSYLDLLKHATKTIVSCLQEHDRFGLVSYSDSARVELNIQEMKEGNKQMAFQAIDGLQDEGCTNIWGGVQMGLDMLRKNLRVQAHQSLLLLTDGEPNVYPPSGLVPSLRQYKEEFKNFYFNLNTFAFGKHIDTPLLDEYSYIGNGQYSFIPCPGFIGTIFVNAIANILNTMGSRAVLQLTMLNGARFKELVGHGIPVQKKGNFVEIQVGDIKFGQYRDLVFKLDIPDNVKQQNLPIMDIQLQYFDHVAGKQRVGVLKQESVKSYNDPLVDAHYCRCYFVDTLREMVKIAKQGQYENAQNLVKNMGVLFKNILQELEDKEYEVAQNKDNQDFLLGRIEFSKEFIENLLKDVEGEVTLAVQHSGSFNHWGKHFLPSLSHAHLKQQCNNFCDPGIQNYGGELNKKIKQQCEKMFLSLPPPKPSKRSTYNYQQQNYQQQQQQQYNQQQQQQQQQNNQVKQKEEDLDMGQYYDCGGGCFGGQCMVRMEGNLYKKVEDLKKGDKVIGLNGCISKVVALVRINNPNKYLKMAKFDNGLLITPKHPIYYEGKWVKPYQVQQQCFMVEMECVYNLILEDNHTVEINGVNCVTFGHEIQDEEAVHEYFGSKKIILDFQRLYGKGIRNDGFVQIGMEQFLRNNRNQSVCGIII